MDVHKDESSLFQMWTGSRKYQTVVTDGVLRRVNRKNAFVLLSFLINISMIHRTAFIDDDR